MSHQVARTEEVRELSYWQFEDGTWVKIIASAGVDTNKALDILEKLIHIRRQEIRSNHV